MHEQSNEDKSGDQRAVLPHPYWSESEVMSDRSLTPYFPLTDVRLSLFTC